MIDQIQAFLVILEEGSVNRASRRLRISQPALSRQMQALEQDIGGTLFERGPWGVRPTDLGHALRDTMSPIIAEFGRGLEKVQQQAKGLHALLRIGYIGSAASSFLTPALAKLREEFSDLKLSLNDLTPGEQIEAIEKGRIDIAMIGQEGDVLNEGFYAKRVATLSVCVAVSEKHPASSDGEPLSRFKEHDFIGASDQEVPGRNRWTEKLCRQAGFQPNFIASCGAIHEVFSMVAGSDAVSLLPDYFDGESPVGTKLIPITDSWATWDFLVLRQRGNSNKLAKRLMTLLAS